MLYDNEKVALWNPETDENEKIKLEQDASEIERLIEEGRALGQLKSSSGYYILQSYLVGTIEDLKHKLCTEIDHKKIRRLQEAVKAYTNVLLFVDFKIHEGLALEQTRQTPEQE